MEKVGRRGDFFRNAGIHEIKRGNRYNAKKRYLARNYILRRDLEKKSLNVELQQLCISAQSTATFIVQMKQNLSQFTFEKDTIIK